MLNFKNWIVNTTINDPTLKTYLMDSNGNMNVFPIDADIQPEQFPCLIYQDGNVSVMSKPQGMHYGNFQIDIYSLLNQMEVENIYTRLAQLFNFKDSTTQTLTGTLWWIREQAVKDVHESERRMWRKTVNYKFWYSNADFT